MTYFRIGHSYLPCHAPPLALESRDTKTLLKLPLSFTLSRWLVRTTQNLLAFVLLAAGFYPRAIFDQLKI